MAEKNQLYKVRRPSHDFFDVAALLCTVAGTLPEIRYIPPPADDGVQWGQLFFLSRRTLWQEFSARLSLKSLRQGGSAPRAGSLLQIGSWTQSSRMSRGGSPH